MGKQADISDAVDSILEDWARERPELDAGTIGVFGRLARIIIKQRVIENSVFEKYGLTLASFDVLANLRRSGEPHRKTAGELASSSMLTTGGITFRLDRMEEQNLIERVRTRTDRRVVYAQLTSHGKEVIDSIFAEHLATQRQMLEGLSSKEVNQLSTLLRKVSASIDEFESGNPALTNLEAPSDRPSTMDPS
ncbi:MULTISPECIES: MarR family winged helix-turn-helix transcriptional regulator [Paenarthrobacter]|uniref:MarR family winged helix-turn-helix transcriptional regulator n=1 Tax=Paenarthrobacter TaxID=1742992 RepID=UPI001FCA5F9B|nr:MarR family transcriptional regulator [Paenarthrobacter nitroguajacolicus]